MNKSESIKEIAGALAKFNGKVSKISKDAANPFFKNNYATLDTIIDEIRPILTEFGLSIMQFPSGDAQNVTLKTLLLHESGEWIESEELTLKPVKNDPQAAGSAITYARRYSLAAFLSLNTGEDDDGNKSTHGDKKPPQNDPNKKNSYPERPEYASEKQVNKINIVVSEIIKAKGDTTTKDDIYEALKGKGFTFNEPKDVPKSQASKMIQQLENWRTNAEKAQQQEQK